MSVLYQTMIENRKGYYLNQLLHKLAKQIERSPYPERVRQTFSYAIYHHLPKHEFELPSTSTQGLLRHIHHAVHEGELDLACLELCYNTVFHQCKEKREIPVHHIIYTT